MHPSLREVNLIDGWICWTHRYKGRSILWKGRTPFESVVAISVHTSPFQNLSGHCTLIHSLWRTQYFWKGNIFCKKNITLTNTIKLTYETIVPGTWQKLTKQISLTTTFFPTNAFIQRSQNSLRQNVSFFQWIAFLPWNTYTRWSAQHTF